MTKQKYTPHVIAASAFFTLGNAIILLPEFNLFEFGLLLALSLAIIFITSRLLKAANENKLAFFCVSAMIVAGATYGAATTFLNYVAFLKNEQLSQNGAVWIGLAFAAICIYFATRSTAAVCKCCLFFAVFSVLIMLVCFIGGIRIFDYGNLAEIKWEFSSHIKKYSGVFLPIVALPAFMAADNKTIKPVIFGVTGGFLLLFMATLQIALTLGNSFDVSYPYLKAVSVISSGSLFTRLDGLVWFLFFIVALLKITICAKAIMAVTKRFKL